MSKWMNKGKKVWRSSLGILLAVVMLASEALVLVQPAYASENVSPSNVKLSVKSDVFTGDTRKTEFTGSNYGWTNFRSDKNYYETYGPGGGNLGDRDGYPNPYNSGTSSTTQVSVWMEGNWGDSKKATQAGLMSFAVGVNVPAGKAYTVKFKIKTELWSSLQNTQDAVFVCEAANNPSSSQPTTNGVLWNHNTHLFKITGGCTSQIAGFYKDDEATNWGGGSYAQNDYVTYTFNNMAGTTEQTFYRYFLLFVAQSDWVRWKNGKISGKATFSVDSCLSSTTADYGVVRKMSDADVSISPQNGNTTMQEMYGWTYPEQKASTSGATNAYSNLYALQVATGGNPGIGVEFFEVQYYSKDGSRHSQYFFPGSEYTSSMEYAKQAGDKVTSQIKIAQSIGLNTSSWTTQTGGLKAMSTDQYIAYFKYDVDYVDSIIVHSSAIVTWTCYGIKLYKMLQCYGVSMYSYATRDTYVDFKGQLIAEGVLEKDSKGRSNESIALNKGQNFVFGNSPCQAEETRKLNSYPSSFTKQARSIFTGKESTEDALDGYRVVKSFTDEASYNATVIYDTHQQYDYLLEIDVADVYGAGLEAYAAVFNRNMIGTVDNANTFEEILAATVLYTDIFGYSHQVFIPVMINAISFLLDTYGRTLNVAGLAQQGDSICVKCKFPYMKEINSLMFTFGENTVESALESATGVGRITPNTSTETTFYHTASWGTRANVTNGTKDTFIFESISLQQFNPGALKADVKNWRATYKSTNGAGKVLSYYKADTLEGHSVSVETMEEVPLVAYKEGDDIRPSRTMHDTYLVEFVTDKITQASTINDVDFTLFYTDESGNEVATEPTSLREANRDYYGWWPASSSQFVSASEMETCEYQYDGSFVYAMAPGNSAFAVVEADDLDAFTGISIHMTENPNRDEYQAGKLYIYELQEYGRTTINRWSQNLKISEGVELDRYYKRENTTETLIKWDQAIYVGDGETKTVDFNQAGSASATQVTTENNDVGKYEEISYAAATQITGGYLTRVRSTYTVTVKVASDDYYSIADGDTGSVNQFYFQLLFKDGERLTTSAYVNANQQLASDRFRGGCEETFYIYCNADYGDIYAIRIIPDDLSVNSDETDKLCIESIRVSKSSTAGNKFTYIATAPEDSMWVNVPFQDDEKEQTGRQESELQTLYYITDKQMDTSLEFAIMTGGLISNGQTSTNEADNYYSQFYGTLYATIKYKTWTGKTTSKSVEVITAIEDYAGKTTANPDGQKFSNRDYMFVPKSTNRFTVDFQDIASLISITFTAKGGGETESGLSIQNISVRQVTENGVLQLVRHSDDPDNLYGEYEKFYSAGKAFNICTQADSEKMPKQIVVSPGIETTSPSIKFTLDNKIRQVADDGIAEEAAKEDVSINDKMNVSVVPITTAGLSAGDAITLKVVYKDKYSNIFETSGKVFYNAAQTVFECKDTLFDATMFCMPVSVELVSSKTVTIGKITITQMRQGSDTTGTATAYEGVKSVSKFDIANDGLPVSTDEAHPSVVYLLAAADSSTYYDYYTQKVYVEFDSTTVEQAITTDKDVVISFRYLRKSDGDNNTVDEISYTSGETSLSELGITKIGPGMVVSVEYNADAVAAISMVRVKRTSEEMGTISVKRAAVSQKIRYLTATNEFAYRFGWLNCDKVAQITGTNFHDFKPTETTMELAAVSKTRLCPVTIQVTTAADDPAVALKSGTENAVKMIVSYMDVDDAVKTVEVADIQKTITSGSLQAGDTATLGVLIPGMKQLLQLKFEPQDTTTTPGAWKIASVAVSGNQGTTCSDFTNEKSVDAWAKGGEPLAVNVSSMLIKGIAILTEDGSVGTASSTDLNSVVFDNAERKTVVGYPALTYINISKVTAEGMPYNVSNWSVKYQQVSTGTDGKEALGTESVVNSVTTGFTLKNDGNADATFRVTVYATNAPSVSATLDVIVPATKAEMTQTINNTTINNNNTASGTNT